MIGSSENRGGSIYRLENLQIFFALLIPVALLAFAKSYFTGVTFTGKSVTVLIHAHTALMVIWLLMLIAQVWFIRTKRFQLHRWVGRSSYAIAPLILVAMIVVSHESLNRTAGSLSTQGAQIEVYTWGQLLGFGLAWSLAIFFRKRTPLHMRFMISTILATGSAFVFRIILNWFGWVPGMDTLDNVVAANGAILTLSLLALVVADWQKGLKWSPYWVVTVVIVIMHVGYFTFAKTQGWIEFIRWFMSLSI